MRRGALSDRISPWVRKAYKEERIPAPLLWTMAAAGMRDWFQLLKKGLRPHLGEETEAALAELARETLTRRYRVLREARPELPNVERDPRALPLLMSALYQLPFASKRRWILADLGGPPRGPAEHLRSLLLVRPMRHRERWEELTVHLGELLIVLTERLPARLPRSRAIVAQICFEMGVAYAKGMRRQLRLPEERPVENAIEVLRTSEYLFRVNPEHESEADEGDRRGYIDGNACPWYSRPGWAPGHCGIFGQFQAGVCSVFGLRYTLTTTIPKHGGDHCRVDLSPINIRRRGEPSNSVRS